MALAIALPAAPAIAAQPEDDVSLTREAFLELSWDHTEGWRYEVSVDGLPVSRGTEPSYLHTSDTLPEGLVVEAVRFEGSISDPNRQEFREPVTFETGTTERLVIRWNPDVYERPYIGYRIAVEGQGPRSGWQTHLIQRRSFIIRADPDTVDRVLFGDAVLVSENRMGAPFDITMGRIERRGDYHELDVP
ncbi:hypothetical protein F1654_01860 [Alkalicaulis satelles]|uniref:Uncharacterized protein n=1 Tax=Alkalicaulis satelles TaxID=2609175 RepID=A0A5M6ZIY3_9PROT|nr:hypothetical protein [Alkalicaulis satelles]KAA5804773.1 hypothetical protein F1654_01860 [Alkalicaulis satelles]